MWTKGFESSVMNVVRIIEGLCHERSLSPCQGKHGSM